MFTRSKDHFISLYLYLASFGGKVDQGVGIHHPAIVSKDVLSSLRLDLLPVEVLATTNHMEVSTCMYMYEDVGINHALNVCIQLCLLTSLFESNLPLHFTKDHMQRLYHCISTQTVIMVPR